MRKKNRINIHHFKIGWAFLFLIINVKVIGQFTSFSSPDTVCTNSLVTFVNNSSISGNFQWNFCTPKLDNFTQDTGLVLSNNWLHNSIYIEDKGNYYGFLLEGQPTKLTRLDFGNSLQNSPTTVSLGGFNGKIDVLGGIEDIQIVKDNSQFYLFICGIRSVSPNLLQTLVRIDLGNSITNLNSVATDISSVGGLEGPASISFAKSSTGWFALVANRSNYGSLLMLNFGNSLSNLPSVNNLGNFNKIYSPNSVVLIKEGNLWYGLVVGLAPGKVFKLNFGNSLLNSPTVSILSMPKLNSVQAWKLAITRDCNYTYCFVTGLVQEEIVRLAFTSLAANPTETKITPNRFFPYQHNLSNIISDGSNAYFFVSKIDVPLGTTGDTLFRWKFNGCENSNLPLFNGYTPPPISFSNPGNYLVSLLENKGTINESMFCRQIIVLNGSRNPAINTYSICNKDSLLLKPSFTTNKYLWNDFTTDSVLKTATAGEYWVKGDSNVCSVNIDSFRISIYPLPVLSVIKSNDIDCSNSMSTLQVTGAKSYTWFPTGLLINPQSPLQKVNPGSTTIFFVVGVDENNCKMLDSIIVKVDFTGNKNLYQVPNAFTPNADGLNDCFGVKHWGTVNSFNFKIFNRWGQIIFETADPGICWNGKYKTGEQATIGAYIYLITGKNTCEGAIKKSGTFLLIR